MDLSKFFTDFQDYVAPKLDVYEQAIYLYIFRHSRLENKDEVVIGFRSAVKKMPLGVGKKGTPIAANQCHEKLRSLQKKGYIEILDTTHTGTKLRIKLPHEIPSAISKRQENTKLDLEEIDFFSKESGRKAILAREKFKCFYCFRILDETNYVIEHVDSRPKGNNSYRNLVASCRNCNNRKGETSGSEFLRALYRSGLLGQEELEDRIIALQLLREGKLVPSI